MSHSSEFSRTEMLFGEDAVNKLKNAKVAVFGVGGVGGYVVEVLARSGVGEIHLFDNDVVSITNINRQIIALHSTIGLAKVDVAKNRINDINPDCKVFPHKMFYVRENADEVNFSDFDYVADCIDTITSKIEIIKRCYQLNVPLICSMGTANKLDPTAFSVADIFETKVDPLAKVIRKKLKELEIPSLKVVYSQELPQNPINDTLSCRFACECNPEKLLTCKNRRDIPASNAFVPASAGLILGGEIIKNLIVR